MLVQIVLVVIGVIILLSGVDFSFIKDWFKKPYVKPEVSDNTEMRDFMETINIWYSLRDRVRSCDLHDACKKLDELFPLLNKCPHKEK